MLRFQYRDDVIDPISVMMKNNNKKSFGCLYCSAMVRFLFLGYLPLKNHFEMPAFHEAARTFAKLILTHRFAQIDIIMEQKTSNAFPSTGRSYPSTTMKRTIII